MLKQALNRPKQQLLPLLVATIAGVVMTAGFAAAEDAKDMQKPTTIEDLTDEERDLVNKFYHLFTTRTQGVMKSTWFGIRTWQHPFDLWVTQEIFTEVAPDLVVETGTFRGGSSIIWAMMLEYINPTAKVITIDIKDVRDPRAPKMDIAKRKVTYLHGSSTAPNIVNRVKKRAAGKKVLLILDSLHTRDHVLDELRAYWELVPIGSYIIVQDSAINGHPIAEWTGPGPWEAVEAFMKENDHFVIDKGRERFLLTNNPNGFLKRVR